jgi:1-acyl-sn-glycerol-3-phosphate acyltransferase
MLFFLEGTRSTTVEIGPFKHGAGLIGLNLGLLVVPIRTRGLFAVLPNGRMLPRPSRATAHIGAPLGLEAAPSIQHITAWIESALRAH